MADALAATLQWHDRFDKSFGMSADDCSDLLDWPGKTAPFSEPAIEAMAGSAGGVDWDKLNRIRGQVKFNVFKSELIEANPFCAGLADTKVVFLMRSAGETRALRELEGGVIVADALWLSFASFCTQTLFTGFPPSEAPGGVDERLRVTTHFALRALLYQLILRREPIDKQRFDAIWHTWPQTSDANHGQVQFLWTGLGRFVIAHELAHILIHRPENCHLSGALHRSIVPPETLATLLASDLDLATLDACLWEVEADLLALAMCEQVYREHPSVIGTFLAGAYYMFLCLCELAARVGAASVYPQRCAAIRNYLVARSAGQSLAEAIEHDFAARAKFFFEMGELFRQAA